MSNIKLFESKQVRALWNEDEQKWYFSITDAIAVLRWLAAVGNERLEEIENPELAGKRMREIYKSKGYSDEWKKRGVKEQTEYSILTAEISKATFGMTPMQYKEHKRLERPTDNLRDHMNDLELIFTMLGEASTAEIARNRSPKQTRRDRRWQNRRRSQTAA